MPDERIECRLQWLQLLILNLFAIPFSLSVYSFLCCSSFLFFTLRMRSFILFLSAYFWWKSIRNVLCLLPHYEKSIKSRTKSEFQLQIFTQNIKHGNDKAKSISMLNIRKLCVRVSSASSECGLPMSDRFAHWQMCTVFVFVISIDWERTNRAGLHDKWKMDEIVFFARFAILKIPYHCHNSLYSFTHRFQLFFFFFFLLFVVWQFIGNW